MVIEKPFASYEEVEQHAQKLRLRSDTAELRFGNHCHALADKEVRSILIKDAVGDALRSMKPVQTAAELVTSGGIGTQVLMGLLTRKGSFMRRLVTSAAAIVLPNLLGKVPWGDVISKVTTGLRTGKVHESNGHSVE